MDDPVSARASLLASISLLIFSAITMFGIIGWLYRAEVAMTWKSVLATGCTLLGGTTSNLMWRTPTRTHAVMGIGVMLLSLLRIGPPGDWTWVSFALVALTFVLLMPLVHAAIVLRDER